jgi:serine phosphatase RsbU (regulator of sigma subunit)
MTDEPDVRRALVIEDDEDIRGLLVHILTKQGFQVSSASTGRAGIELMKRDGAELVTLDLNLPDIDGVEVCRELRKFSDAYILMISARGEELDRLTGLDTGADDYLTKPFSPRELGSRITALFRRPRASAVHEAAVQDELRRAVEVQRSLLPAEGLSLDGFDIAGAFRPSRNVGGDFFDWYPKDGGLQLTLADAMGKGMGAALIAATVRAVMRSVAHNEPLGDAFRSAARILEADLEQSASFVTLFHARLTAATGVLHYVDAGHGLALHIKAGGSSARLITGGPPVGAWPGQEWDAHQVALEPGDSLAVVSDGLLDVYPDVEVLTAVVAGTVSGSASAQEACDAVLELASGRDVSDDATVVVLTRAPRQLP